MIVGYAREDTKNQTLELQLNELKKYGCDEIIIEEYENNKIEFKQLGMMLARLGKDDVLVVWELDRIGKTVYQLIRFLLKLGEKEIYFVSIKDDIDTRTKTGEIILHIFDVLKSMEKEVINERARAGICLGRARGRSGGRKKAHTKDKINTAYRMYKSGQYTIPEIYEILGMSRSTFYRYIKMKEEERGC